MAIYIIASIAVILFLFYRNSTSGIRKTTKVVGAFYNIKPIFVEDMIITMGSEKGHEFGDRIKNTPSEYNLTFAVYTFFIYQVLKNPHSENVNYWKDLLKEKGLSTELEQSTIDLAFVYLEGEGNNIGSSKDFLGLHLKK